MHFALPPRKTSRPPPYAASRPSRHSYTRRTRLRAIAWVLGGIAVLIFLFTIFRGSSSRTSEAIPPGTPRAVLITVFDHSLTARHEKMIIENRELYARKQGYATFFPHSTDYDLSEPPSTQSWAKIPAIRHAMTLNPHSTYFFFLCQHALIMRPDLSLDEHIMKPSRLKEILIPEQPVVPPDSVIRTFKNVDPEDIDCVLTQDNEGLADTSMIVRRGEWAKFFLDSWFDPLYRSYNFQRAESHALEHLVQWHGTVLERMAIVPQKFLNSYTRSSKGHVYKDGDFIANMYGCNVIGSGRSCEDETTPMHEHLMSIHGPA